MLLPLLLAACGGHHDGSSREPGPDGCPATASEGALPSSPPAGTDPFYAKYLDANGIPILGSSKVCDRALQVADEIVSHLLGQRTDVTGTLVANHVSVGVFARSEVLTDLPNEHDLAGVYVDAARTRKFDELCGVGGTSGRPTAICERNLIGLDDPYMGLMSVLIHEFGHTIQNQGLDAATAQQVDTCYTDAQTAGLFPGNAGAVSYMMSNQYEFFAEGTGNWFNAADPSNPANSPEETGRSKLSAYDAELYFVLASIYPADDWAYPQFPQTFSGEKPETSAAPVPAKLSSKTVRLNLNQAFHFVPDPKLSSLYGFAFKAVSSSPATLTITGSVADFHVSNLTVLTDGATAPGAPPSSMGKATWQITGLTADATYTFVITSLDDVSTGFDVTISEAGP